MENAHILVVEDEKLLNRLLKETLSNEGYRVSTAYNGEEALKLFRNQQPDLVILEIMLPDMSGEDVIRQIRAEGNHVPIIVFSSSHDPIDEVKVIDLGSDDYIRKPFHTDVLFARVRARLTAARVQRTLLPKTIMQFADKKRTGTIKIFFCYAHEDELLLDKLKAHLRPLQRQGLIDIWHDRNISAGTEWEQEINKHLNEAEFILLLVSPDFINSDYCYSREMKRAMERHARGEAHVIPIILRHVYWQGILGNLQALPTDAKPVTSSHWHTIDEAFLNVTEGILRTLQEPREQSSTGEVSASYDPFSHEAIPTGFEDLDRILGGGFQRSDLIIVGAPPSTGKTSFALNIVLNTAIKYARSVGIFSLEMSKQHLVQRLLSLDAHINQQMLQTGKLENEEWDRVVYALDAISEAKIWIIDSADITIIEVLRQAQKLVKECKVDLIIVDYVNFIQTRDNQNYDISRLLKVMARQLNVPVLALVQMSRIVEYRRSKVPQLSDMDDSFEKDADIIMLLHRDDVYNPESERKNIADIIVAKHRNGPVGEISLYFRPDIGYFHDLDFNPPRVD